MGRCHETFKFEEGIGREPMSSWVIGQKATTLTTRPIGSFLECKWEERRRVSLLEHNTTKNT